MRLSPQDGGAYVWYDFMCIANMLMGQDLEALPWGRKAAETNRGYPMAHYHYAAALALCGRLAQARAGRAQTRAGFQRPALSRRHAKRQ